MFVKLNDVPRINTYIWKRTDDYIKVVSLTTGRESILNPLFSKVWSLVDGKRTVQQIYNELKSREHITPKLLINILNALANLDLITTKNYLWE